MGLYIPNRGLPKYGCDHCWFRSGNFCILTDDVVVEAANKGEIDKRCVLVEIDLPLSNDVLKEGEKE